MIKRTFRKKIVLPKRGNIYVQYSVVTNYIFEGIKKNNWYQCDKTFKSIYQLQCHIIWVKQTRVYIIQSYCYGKNKKHQY